MTRSAVLFAFALAACTSENPDYRPFTEGCDSVGQRFCAGSRPIECVAGDDSGVLKTLACHTNGACTDGLCTAPAPAKPCVRDKDCFAAPGPPTSVPQSCAAFVDATGVRLGTFCASNDGPASGPAPCRLDTDCRTGLCIGATGGAAGRCFAACENSQDCPAGTVCGAFDVTITGVRGTVRSCSP